MNQIPNLRYLFNCNPVNQAGCPSGQGVSRAKDAINFTNFGQFIGEILNVAFLIAVFLAFFWLVWAAFQYIAAGGDKQRLAQARSRITWTIVGLLLIAISFLVAQFVQQSIQPKGGTPIL